MNGRGNTHSSKGYVLGNKSFAAISAVEGLTLRSESRERLERTASLTPSQRRAETVRAFSGTQKRG
jgi:hypothetical protein